VVNGVAAGLGLTVDQATVRLGQEDVARHVGRVVLAHSGYWFDAQLGKLVVAVTSASDADQVGAVGAVAQLVERSQAELDRLMLQVDQLVVLLGWPSGGLIRGSMGWFCALSEPYPVELCGQGEGH